jgi:hypothetical protein
VATHGWDYNGSRNWRSRLIYETNIRTSYAAGRWKQMTDPETRKVLPYLMYKHGDSKKPRPEHLAWDGLTLPADDPWWETHYPPNDWGCSCQVFAVSGARYEAAKEKGKTSAPPDAIDPKTGNPVGLGKGWDYNVGSAAFGKSWVPEDTGVQELEPAWRATQYPHLPMKLAVSPLPVSLAQKTKSAKDIRNLVPVGVYEDVMGESLNVTQRVADHFLAKSSRLDGREQYLPLLPDVIANAAEVWVGFIKHIGSGRVYLRRRYVRAYNVGKGKTVGVLAEMINGQAYSFDLIKSDDLRGGRLRSGRLIYPKR